MHKNMEESSITMEDNLVGVEEAKNDDSVNADVNEAANFDGQEENRENEIVSEVEDATEWQEETGEDDGTDSADNALGIDDGEEGEETELVEYVEHNSEDHDQEYTQETYLQLTQDGPTVLQAQAVLDDDETIEFEDPNAAEQYEFIQTIDEETFLAMQEQSADTIYECQICNKSFRQHAAFNKHLKQVHLYSKMKKRERVAITNAKQVMKQMKEIGSSPIKKPSLVRRTKLANEVHCTYCDYGTTSLNALGRHIHEMHFKKEGALDSGYTQHNNFVYKCNYCRFTANDEDKVEEHVTKHIKKCHYCDFETRSPAQLRQHIKDAHVDKLPPQVLNEDQTDESAQQYFDSLSTNVVHMCNVCYFITPDEGCLKQHIFEEHHSEAEVN